MNKNHSVSKQGNNIILTPIQNPERTLIFLHGLGDSADGWYQTFLEESLNLQDSKVILLTAPIAPVSINGGMKTTSWFDILPNSDFLNQRSYNEASKNAEKIQTVIESEIEFYKGDASRVFVGGFSQGAAMSLMIGFENKHEIGGVVALSGFFFPETKIKNQGLKVLITHGEDDEVIPFAHAQLSFQKIKAFPHVKIHPISYLGHSIDRKVLKLMAAFFKK